MKNWHIIPASRRIWAAVIALMAFGIPWTGRTPSNWLLMSALLLMSWQMAFIPSPPASTPLRKVYKASREGRWRTSTSSKLVTLLSALLLISSFVMQFR